MKLNALITTAALVLASSSIQAALITDSTSFNMRSISFYDYEYGTRNDPSAYRRTAQNLTLDGFDSSLGTLTGVSISYDTNWSLSTSVRADDSRNNWGWDTSQGSSQAWNRMTIDLVNPNGPASVRTEYESESCRRTTRTGLACYDRSYSRGNFDGNMSLGSLALSDFLDTTLNLTITRQLWAEADSNDRDSRVYAWNYNNGWNGRVNVSYTYDVPEPSVLALLGAGILGLGFASRRRKKSA